MTHSEDSATNSCNSRTAAVIAARTSTVCALGLRRLLPRANHNSAPLK